MVPHQVSGQSHSTATSPHDVITAMFANQADWLIRNAAGAVHPAAPPLPLHTGSLVLAGSHGVAWASPESGAVEAALAWLRHTASTDALVWSAMEQPEADVLVQARGGREGFRPRWMWRDLRAPLPDPRLDAPVAVGVATGRERDALRAARTVPYVTPAGIERILDLALAGEAPRQTWLVVARQRRRLGEGDVVGVAILHLTHHGGETSGGLYNLGVDPGWQGKGIGTALTLEICRIAHDHGANRVALNATPSGERVYRQLDFAVAGDGQTWYVPESVLRDRPSRTTITAAEAIARGEVDRLEPAVAGLEALPNGESPIRFAARFRRRDVIGWLLEHDAAPDIAPLWSMGFRREVAAAARNGRWLDHQWGPEATTPLHDAVRMNDEALLRLLISAGADLTIRDSQWNGRPLDWANALGHPNLAAIILEAMRVT